MYVNSLNEQRRYMTNYVNNDIQPTNPSRQYGYGADRLPRSVGKPLPKNDPDVALVEWLLSSYEARGLDLPPSPNSIDDKSPWYSYQDTLWKGDDYSKRNIEENAGLIGRRRLKRDEDGNGIAFHQCYFNPISCFRK